ncbi:uncharacterized protein cd44a [Symphorus nematophorus]
MAQSQVSGRKMRNLLFMVILGLLAVVHSTPVNTVAQDEVYREAVTEGYLVDEFLLPSLTTEPPKRNVTVLASQQPKSESKDGDMMEGSGDESMTHLLPLHRGVHYATTTQSSTIAVLPWHDDDSSSHSSNTQAPQSGVTYPSEPDEELSTNNDVIEDTTYMSSTPEFIPHGDENYASTTPSVSHAPSSTSTPFPVHPDDSSSHSSTTQAPQSGVTSPSEPDDDLSTDNDAIEDATYMSTTSVFLLSDFTSASVPNEAPSSVNPDFISSGSGCCSGDDYTSDLSSGIQRSTMTSTTTTETSTESLISRSGSAERVVETVIIHEAEEVRLLLPAPTAAPSNAGHSTPGWIIIVGFIVGVAALVMLCLAIATRDKWNGPREASQAKANPSNQQRELEMETFLHKDNPRENGKAAEYTVIPLDELPEKYSSH